MATISATSSSERWERPVWETARNRSPLGLSAGWAAPDSTSDCTEQEWCHVNWPS
jgi:hypothetical protein